MKIIRKGEASNLTWWHDRRTQCPGCDTVIQFEASDVRTYGFIRQDRNELRHYCPTCPATLSVLRAKDDTALLHL